MECDERGVNHGALGAGKRNRPKAAGLGPSFAGRYRKPEAATQKEKKPAQTKNRALLCSSDHVNDRRCIHSSGLFLSVSSEDRQLGTEGTELAGKWTQLTKCGPVFLGFHLLKKYCGPGFTFRCRHQSFRASYPERARWFCVAVRWGGSIRLGLYHEL